MNYFHYKYKKMQEVIISENTDNIIKSGQVLTSLNKIDNRLKESEERIGHLMSNLNNSEGDIAKVVNGDKGRSWLFGSIKKEALLELIQDENKAVSETVSSISKLIQSSNENSKVHSEMISGLAMLSAMSFKQISESASEVEALTGLLTENSEGDNNRDGQIRDIVKYHIQSKKNENEWKNSIEYNLGVVNNNIKDTSRKIEKNISNLNNKLNSSIESLDEKVSNDLQSEIKRTTKIIKENKDYHETKIIDGLKSLENKISTLLLSEIEKNNKNIESNKIYHETMISDALKSAEDKVTTHVLSDIKNIENKFTEVNEGVDGNLKKLYSLMNSKSEDHFIKVLATQKKQIKHLSIFSIILSLSFVYLIIQSLI